MLDNINVLGYSGKQLLLPLATAVGAFGGFPKAPAFFSELTNNEVGRYLVLFILIWQGGAGQDMKLALMVTALMYVLSQVA